MRYLQRASGAACLLCIAVLLTFWTVKRATPSSSGAELALYSVTTLTALIWIVIETAQRRHIQRAELELIRLDIVPGFGMIVSHYLTSQSATEVGLRPSCMSCSSRTPKSGCLPGEAALAHVLSHGPTTLISARTHLSAGEFLSP